MLDKDTSFVHLLFQPFWNQGLVSWKTIFSRTGRDGFNFIHSPATHGQLCGSVPNRPWISTGDWGPLFCTIRKVLTVEFQLAMNKKITLNICYMTNISMPFFLSLMYSSLVFMRYMGSINSLLLFSKQLQHQQVPHVHVKLENIICRHSRSVQFPPIWFHSGRL